MAAPIGNDNARKGKRFKSVIAERLEQRAAWDKIVDKAIDQALEGDHTARSWLADRNEGKPMQQTEISGPEGSPIDTQYTVKFVKPDAGT